MLTVACVFVTGPYPYTAEYVVRLERMVRKFLSRPFQFVCLTDRAAELPNSIHTIEIPSLCGIVPDASAGYWNKVRLFDPTLGLTGRVLYIDLDSLIVAPLDPIVDYPALFALTTDALVEERAHLNTDRYGRSLVRRFNSSVMVFTGGQQSKLWSAWSPEVAFRLSGDQDWIGEQAKDAIGMPLSWFPRLSRVQPPWPEEAKVVLAKKPKPHEAVLRWSWFEPLWGAA